MVWWAPPMTIDLAIPQPTNSPADQVAAEGDDEVAACASAARASRITVEKEQVRQGADDDQYGDGDGYGGPW